MDRDNKLLTALYSHFLVMKTFHFQTATGFRHTKTDEYVQKYLSNMDKMMEVVQGIDSVVTIKDIHIRVKTRGDEEITMEINSMISTLEQERGRSSSIDAIIDVMQGDLQQLAYLFGFQ